MTFTGHEVLDDALARGDTDAVVTALHGIPRANRAALAPALRERVIWLDEHDNPPIPWEEKEPHRNRGFAVGAALFVCGTARDAAGAFVRDTDRARLAHEFDPPSLQGLGEAVLSLRNPSIGYLNAFIEAGLIPRPDNDAHTLLMMDLPTYAGWKKKQSMEDYVAGDATLHGVILRVMEIEGTSQASLAAVDKYRQDAWATFFASDWAQRYFGRDLLLDKTLDALERDWPQFRSSWFSRFHERLAPSDDELHARLPRYLELLRSRIPPTVGMALKCVDTINAAFPIDSDSLFDALAPVMHAAAKGHVEGAMKLIDHRIRDEPARAHAAAQLLVDAIGHADAGVQARAIKRLGKIAIDPDTRDALASYLTTVAASNRAALAAIVGIAADDSEPPAMPEADVARLPGPLDTSRELPRIDDIDTLAERVAYVFENDHDIDAFEQVITALTRMAPLDGDASARLAPAAKRIPRLRTPIAQALGQVLASLLHVPALPYERQVNMSGEHAAIDIHVIDRVADTVETARRGASLEPLDAATHRGGFIDPRRLAQRIAAHAAAGVACERRPAVRALLRLPPRASVPEELSSLDDSALSRAMHYALGGELRGGDDDVALLVAASRIRHPGEDDPVLLARLGDLGPDTTRAPVTSWTVAARQHAYDNRIHTFHDLRLDADDIHEGADPLFIAQHRHRPASYQPRYALDRWSYAGIVECLVRYAATIMPGCLDTFFAEGVSRLGNNLDWPEAQWQNRAYLMPLLEPTVAPGPMGTLMLALALAGKEPGQTALAVDALVQTAREGRLDAQRLARDMRDLLALDHVRAARYVKALTAALRSAPDLRPLACRLLERMLEARPEAPPRDAAQLLALLRETLLETGSRISEDTRTYLPSLKLTGRGATLRKALLAGT